MFLSTYNTVTQKQCSCGLIELIKPDAILIKLKDDVIITVDHIKEITEIQGKLSNYRKLPVITYPGKFTDITAEARSFLTSHEAVLYTLIDIYVIRSLPQKILADFYLKINKPKVPTKLFNTLDMAIEYLYSVS